MFSRDDTVYFARCVGLLGLCDKPGKIAPEMWKTLDALVEVVAAETPRRRKSAKNSPEAALRALIGDGVTLGG